MMEKRVKIGINGFGRIGRMILRAYFENKTKYDKIEVSYINDLSDIRTNIHLLKYDSVHGRIGRDIQETANGISIDGQEISMISESNPENLEWNSREVDIVLECSGRFTKRSDAAGHLKAGAKRVLVSAPSEGADFTVIYGINHTGMKREHEVISNGSCTTNCLAPIAQLIDEHFGIEYGFMTTVHAFTGDQRLVDTVHKDLRRARSAPLSMIPSTTGAAKTLGLVLPNLTGRLDGAAIRVPTANVSMIDLKCTISKAADRGTINDLARKASRDRYDGILGYCDEPLVSADFNHSTMSSVFDATGTVILGNHFCRVVSWYDNEFGFSNRMLDVAQYLSTGS
ncbi:MAG: type I glyceraldehyde-3-phosphate dehydrogenase [Holosporales bacterium]|jgi:glyceraldehyde 3-phosphate dehydrogenase|nr:type I glyceraldehyde-3-phosphate dehydrogenase [Holosporales bacterium]